MNVSSCFKIIASVFVVSLAVNFFTLNNITMAESITPDDYSGLWLTGVDDSNKKLGNNATDTHWRYMGATNMSGSATCQPFVDSGGTPARTVVERGDGINDSFGPAFPDIRNAAFGAHWPDSSNLNNSFSWKFTSTKARWISQNSYGLHNSNDPFCKDPSGVTLEEDPNSESEHATVRNSNTFTFKLNDGFEIKEGRGINKASLGLRIKLQTDNLIRVKINKNVMKMEPRYKSLDESSSCHEFASFLTGSWFSGEGMQFICPEFLENSTVELNLSGGDVFNIGTPNTLSIEIFSTYPNMGFIIDEINLTGDKTPPSYTISATSKVSQPTAIEGNAITWTHSVDNNGPDKTAEDIATAISPSGFTSTVNKYPKTTPKGVPKGNIRNLKSDIYIIKKSDEGKTLCQSITYDAIGGDKKGASTPACVKVNAATVEKTDCRPIQVTVPAAIRYPAISHSDPWGRSYNRSTETIPVKATAKGSTVYINNNTSKVIIDKLYSTNYITQLLTDGEPNTVYYSETRTHVTGWTDHYVPDYNSPIYGYTPNYSTSCTTSTVNGKSTTSCTTYISSYTRYIAGYNYKYSGSTTENYSGLVTSSEPTKACFDYKLDANINSFGSKVEAGASINISTTVDNTPFTQPSSFWSFYHTSSKSHPANWQISVLKLVPGQFPDGGFSKPKDQNSISACSYFDPSGLYSCSSNLPGFTLTGNRVFWPGTSSVASVNFIAPDELAGTKYCFAFSVNDPQNVDMAGQGRTWSHAAFNYANNCIVIVKKPKVQVWGGDLFVGRGSSRNSSSGSSMIKTSTSLIADKSSGKNILYGSWGEYGIFASSTIAGMASGSFYRPSIPGAVNNVANDVCNYSKLTFTNSGTSTCTSSSPKGYFSNSKKMPDVEATFLNTNPSFIISNSLNIGGLSTGIYKSSTSSLSISGGTIPLGRWFIVYAPDAVVRITGDIKYNTTDPIKKLSDIPQMIIIARDININDNVKQVDSWLIANGALNTCASASPGSAGLKTTKCNNTLMINGQISTGKLYLHRTAGADPKGHTGDPAEILNLRADAYLWSYARATENGNSARVVYSNEMPVRF